MKEKIRELFYSFLALFLFGCALASAVFFSILLIPLLIITISVIAIKEMIPWRKMNRRIKDQSMVIVERRETALVRTIPENSPHERAA